jgi:pimeloyl-ACP methyl ester carboxylesterase
VNCRSLVVRGETSRRFSRETVERMARDVMPDALAREIAGAGHNSMLNRPETLSRVLAEFFGAHPILEQMSEL